MTFAQSTTLPTGIRPDYGMPESSRRRGPSLLAAWRWEHRKAGNAWFWVAMAAVTGLGMMMGLVNYHSYQTQYEADGPAGMWAGIWTQGTMIDAMMLFPLVMAAFVAQISVNEVQGRNWLRAAAGGTSGVMVAGKALHMLETAVIAAMLIVAIFFAVGVSQGVSAEGFSPYLVRIVPLALALWSSECLTLWMGAFFTSFAAIFGVSAIWTIVGAAVTFLRLSGRVGFDLYKVFPSSMISAAVGVDGSTALMPMLATSAASLGWGLIFLALAAARLRRAAA